MIRKRYWWLWIVVISCCAACSTKDFEAQQTLAAAQATEAMADATLQAAATSHANQLATAQTTRAVQSNELDRSVLQAGRDAVIVLAVALVALVVAIGIVLLNYRYWKRSKLREIADFNRRTDQAKKDRPPANWPSKFQ